MYTFDRFTLQNFRCFIALQATHTSPNAHRDLVRGCQTSWFLSIMDIISCVLALNIPRLTLRVTVHIGCMWLAVRTRSGPGWTRTHLLFHTFGHLYPSMASEYLGSLIPTLRWDSIGAPLYMQCWSGDPECRGHIQVIKD